MNDYILTIEDIGKAFKTEEGTQEVLKDISLQVERNKVLCLLVEKQHC